MLFSIVPYTSDPRLTYTQNLINIAWSLRRLHSHSYGLPVSHFLAFLVCTPALVVQLFSIPPAGLRLSSEY
jgi:hypothetical protein